MLKGRRLSEAQRLGLEILILLDRQAEQERETERLRQSILIANPDLSGTLYPRSHSISGEPVEEIVDVDGTYSLTAENTSYDYREVTWERPEDLGDDELKLLGRMLGDPNVTVSEPVEALEEVEGSPEPDVRFPEPWA